jgi:6,7-dimethyl-8-ribityllumazine synthase
MKKGIDFPRLDGSNLKIGVVVSRWNKEITDNLLEGCLQALDDCGVKKEHVTILRVVGAYELPYAASRLIQNHSVDAVVALGCLIKGETMHFEYIADAVATGLMKLNIETDTPVMFGVLTCLTEEQAAVRSTGEHNHGYGWGMAAVEMGLLKNA